MCDFYRIVYIDPLSDGDTLPPFFSAFRKLTWSRSACVRWIRSTKASIEADMQGALLVVLEWPPSSKGAKEAEAVCEVIRAVSAEVPILLFRRSRGASAEFKEAKAKYSRGYGVQEADPFQDLEACDAALKLLNVQLPSPKVTLDVSESDLALGELLAWLGGDRNDGKERLRLIVEKFFPTAALVQVKPVGGGWSGARLCRIVVSDKEYFLKFFGISEDYDQELKNHAAARKWLGCVLVDLKLVPGISGDVEAQAEAFPLDHDPPALPVCYESASAAGVARKTLKEVYRTTIDDARIMDAFGRLLDILADRQEKAETIESIPPWTHVRNGEFFLKPSLRQSILGTLDDLDIYGDPMCSGCADSWSACRNALEKLIFQSKPSWLYASLRVTLGHTHGDPNPRNCLVDSEDFRNILLIDSGGYREKGRLVSDLAIIERDLKLVLLGTEETAKLYYDLDVNYLANWCHAEKDSIDRWIVFAPGHAPAPTARKDRPGEFYTAIHRAYKVIGLVRERARAVCEGAGDVEGRHYFAALLYWTLDILQYQNVRPTKKLLALYSAAEILGH